MFILRTFLLFIFFIFAYLNSFAQKYEVELNPTIELKLDQVYDQQTKQTLYRYGGYNYGMESFAILNTNPVLYIIHTYNTVYKFDLTSIPRNAINVTAYLETYYGSFSSGSAVMVTVPDNLNFNYLQDSWEAANNGTNLYTVDENQNVLHEVTSMVTPRISQGYINFGARRSSSGLGYIVATLHISYDAPATITADNNFTDNSGQGTHGSIKVDGSTYTAPFPFQRYTGTNVTLEAVSPQTDNQGYQRIWNTGSGTLSYWNRNGVLSWSNQTYGFTVSSSDNGATYQAQLRQLSGPKFAYFYQEPDPLYNGGTGYVYAVFSSEVGNVTYSWSAYSDPTNITLNITPEGSRCQVHYYTPYNTNPTITLVCTARNAYGSNTQGYQLHTALYSYSSFASLAFETNGVLTDENPILVSSVDNPGFDVTDYYLINEKIVPENNTIKFLIHETDQVKGHTDLDQVELWEVKDNKNEFIAVTEEGEVISYKKLETPNQIILNDSLDITNILADKDKLKLTVKKGDRLKIKQTGSTAYSGEELYSIIYAQLYNAEDLSADNNISGKYYFRPQPSAVCKKIKVLLSGGIEIKFNEDLILDYFALVKNEKTARVEKLNLLSAEHDKAGETATLFTTVNEQYGEILPGEKIKFKYETKLNSNNDNTAYILKTVGKYEKASLQKEGNLGTKSALPKETTLYDNYPNPFNPSTTINYQLPQDGMVTIKVYDMLGREVATLVNETKPAGYYKINFDASKLTSGVYIYTIRANNYVQSKKMLLIK